MLKTAIFITALSAAVLVIPGTPAHASDNTSKVHYGQQQDLRAKAPACVGRAIFDNIHPSGADYSMHGWWEMVDGCAPGDTANLTGQLQAKAPDGHWVYVGAPGGKTGTFERGGSANRMPFRVTCRSAAMTTYRAEMDIDLVGYVDDPRKDYSQEYTVPCGY